MKPYYKKLSLSTPKNVSSKRASLSKSRKSGKSELDNFLNAPFKQAESKIWHLSTSVEYNPEMSLDSPFHKLFKKPISVKAFRHKYKVSHKKP